MITKTLAMGYRLKKIPSRMLYKCKGKKKKTNTNMYKLAASKKKSHSSHSTHHKLKLPLMLYTSLCLT